MTMKAGAVLAAVALLLIVLGLRHECAHRHGEALYRGLAPLPARLPGHADALPPTAARCANCHQGGGASGPLLSAASLTAAHARRGGAASRYDQQALCRALRDGVDPAGVSFTRAMPRFAASDADCAALWAYLSNL